MPEGVLIVDDDAGFRAAVRSLLEADGISVVGEAADGAAAFSAVSVVRPAVVLLDVQLPDVDGFEVAGRLVAAGLAVVVVMTSSRPVSEYRSRLERSPARGFIAKEDLTALALRSLVDSVEQRSRRRPSAAP